MLLGSSLGSCHEGEGSQGKLGDFLGEPKYSSGVNHRIKETLADLSPWEDQETHALGIHIHIQVSKRKKKVIRNTHHGFFKSKMSIKIFYQCAI